MIFVTVGTHEQPFDRLLTEIDRLKENGTIQETGHDTIRLLHMSQSIVNGKN